jgi:hypothetical protein
VGFSLYLRGFPTALLELEAVQLPRVDFVRGVSICRRRYPLSAARWSFLAARLKARCLQVLQGILRDPFVGPNARLRRGIDTGRCTSRGLGNHRPLSKPPSSSWKRAHFHQDLSFIELVPLDTRAVLDRKQKPEFRTKTLYSSLGE